MLIRGLAGDRGVVWALRVLAQPALQRVIASEGDIDFPARMFGSLARSAPEVLAGLPMPWMDWALRRLRIAPRVAVIATAEAPTGASTDTGRISVE